MAIQNRKHAQYGVKVARQADQEQSLRTSAALANCIVHVRQWK